MEYPHVAVVGQGTMGRHFRDCLLDSGREVTAFDVDEAALDDAAAAGAARATDPADAAHRADAVLVSVPGTPYVEAAMEGADGILAGLDGGADAVVDVGTTLPDAEVHYAREARERGAAYLDAPVTWTGPGDGVNMFVGGEAAAYDRLADLLDDVAARHERYGEVGVGQAVKAAQRVEQMFHKVTHVEVVEFLRASGADPERLNDHLDWGLDERFFRQTYPEEAGPERTSGVRLNDDGPRPHLRTGAHKDIQYALDVAHAAGAATPLLAAAYEVLKANARYREALDDHGEAYEWGVRTGTAYWRRNARPEAEWRRLTGADD